MLPPDTPRKKRRHPIPGDARMLGWGLTFLLLTLVAALPGFSGVALTSARIGKALFLVFLLFFLVTLMLGFTAERRALRGM